MAKDMSKARLAIPVDKDGQAPPITGTNRAARRKTSKVGQNVRVNKRLACRHCGYWFIDWMELWVIKMHFEFWHDTEQIDLLTADRNSRVTDITGEHVTMAESQEITDALRALASATAEAKQATSALNSAKKEADYFFKSERAKLAGIVEAAVEQAVGQNAAGARQAMVSQIKDTIARIEADWREKLGL